MSKDVVDKYKMENKSDWQQMLINFEKVKRALNPQNRSQSVNVPLSFEFIMSYQNATKNNITQLSHRGVTFANGNLRFPYEIMKHLFNPVVNGIVGHVKELLAKDELKHVSLVLLVGGFGESPVLQVAVKEALQCYDLVIKLLVPPEASLCVMKGAVLFGHDPGDIAERVSRKVYGLEMMNPYDPLVHYDKKKTQAFDSVTYAKDVFCKWVDKYEKIQTGEKKTFTVFCLSDFTSLSFAIYQTDRIDSIYTDEDGMEKVGRFDISIPGKGHSREIKYTVTFGSTEIEVEAWDPQPGGEKKSCKVDFLTR